MSKPTIDDNYPLREDWRGYARSVDENGRRRYPDLFADLLADPDPHFGDEAILVGDDVEFHLDGEVHSGNVTVISDGLATIATDRNYFSGVPISSAAHVRG